MTVGAMHRRIREGRIRDIMTSPLYTVRPETSIRDLKILFALHDTSGFAVVDERRRLRGVVTVFDVLRAFRSSSRPSIADLRALWGERVEDIMSRGVGTLAADEPITAAVEMMLNRSVGAVPVMDHRRGDRRFIGMVHLRDVLGALIFESPASHGRDTANGRHARYGERAAGHDPHSRQPQARRAS